MDREDQEADVEYKRDEIKPQIVVETIPKSEMEDIKASPPEGHIKVTMGTWEETDGTVPLVNVGAGPCLIVYVVNKETGHVISGHFPEVSHKKQDMLDKAELQRTEKQFPPQEPSSTIAIPTPDEVRLLSYVRVDKNYQAFLAMEERIREWGAGNTELFMFGNNSSAFGQTPAEYGQRYVESMIEQHDVSAEFHKLGISYSDQHDHRVPGEHNVDDTAFLPERKVIKHCIRDHKEGGMYWIKDNS